MKEKKSLFFSVFFGLITVILVMVYLKNKEKELIKGMRQVNVVIAVRDIPIRSLITNDMLEVSSIPEKFVQPSAIIVKERAKDIARVVDKINLVPIAAGQQVLQSAILPPSPETGLSVKIPSGLRAMDLPVTSANFISFIKPGDYIDIINTSTIQAGGGKSAKITVTVLQNILVLGVGKNLGDVKPAERKEAGGKLGGAPSLAQLTLTVAVTPGQAQKLALAKEQGEIAISLRPHGEDIIEELLPVSSVSLIGG